MKARVRAPDPARTETLAHLAAGEIRPLGLLPRASNYTFLAEVGTGSDSLLAVYKPRDGEVPLWDFPEGTLCRREVAAYELASALGWPDIPPTVLREGPLGPGSVQLFVEADPDQHYFTLRETCLELFAPVAAFDVLANNADRKSGHCLRDEAGTVWVVDHGVCFSTEPKLRTVIWEFAGDALPPPLVEDIRRVRDVLRTGPLRSSMTELLSPAEVDAVAHRAETLVAKGRFPLPTSARPYPWPPI